MTTSGRRRPKASVETDRFIRAGARFLKSRGWVSLVGGPIRIQAPVPLANGQRIGKFELVMEFTGGKNGARPIRFPRTRKEARNFGRAVSGKER